MLSNEKGMDVSDETREYFKDLENDFMKLWTHPKYERYKIKNVTQRVFSIPATSAASERVFSKADLLMAPLRSSTGEKTPERLCFLRCNAAFVPFPTVL